MNMLVDLVVMGLNVGDGYITQNHNVNQECPSKPSLGCETKALGRKRGVEVSLISIICGLRPH
jgi:hypothetical protein